MKNVQILTMIKKQLETQEINNEELNKINAQIYTIQLYQKLNEQI